MRIEALLRHYWVAEVPEPVRVMMLRDWMDILDPFSQAEIDAACRAWLREHPREKPRPGDMVAAIGAARRALAPRTREPEPDTFIPRDQRMTAAKADEIVASIMGRKRFGGGEE